MGESPPEADEPPPAPAQPASDATPVAPDGCAAQGAPGGSAAEVAPEDGPPAPGGAAAPLAEPELEPGEGSEPGDESSSRRGRSVEEKPVPPPLDRLEGAVEAMLLAAGEALSADRLRDLLGLPSSVHVREAVEALRAKWAAAGLSVEIQGVAGGHRVVTRPEFAEYVRRLWRKSAADRLSPTLLETLSIVAYRQPVARAEIERIRGVQCGEALRALLERRVVKVAGRSDQPGRPLLYATTTRFLEVFGLASLEDLPNAKDLRI